MAEIPSGGGGGVAAGGSGSIRVTNITPQSGGEVVDTRVWQDTAATVLQSCRSTTLDLDVAVAASFPMVEVDGNAAELALAADGGHYSGTVPITIAGAGPITVKVITPDDTDGATDTVGVTLAVPAEITALSFTGGYPGAQTEVAQGQTYDITVTADKSFNQVVVANQDAGAGQTIGVTPGSGPTVVSINIADRGDTPQLLPAHVQVRDTSTGAFSASRSTNELGGGIDGVDVVNLNDRYPVIDGVGKGGATGHSFSIVYPGAQQALKGSETASVTAPVTFFDTMAYSAPGGDLDVTPLTTYSDPKVVTRVGGSYNISSDNFRITANRAANGTQTIVQGVVNIANVAALATASFSGARVRSGVAPGNSTVITLAFNQQMVGTPTMDPAAGRGTFTTAWTGGPTSWVRTLRVPDSENPADNSPNSWTNISATSLSGIPTSVITTGPTYIVGGFAPRTLNYPPLTPNSTETFPLTTEANLSVGVFSNGNPGVIQPFGTPDTSVAGREGWCAPTAGSGAGTQMRMLHIPTVAANGAGLTLTLVEETA